jgi:hypothetical protein
MELVSHFAFAKYFVSTGKVIEYEKEKKTERG